MHTLNNPLGNTDPTGKVACTVSDPAVNNGAPFESDCSTFTDDGEDITDQEAQAAQAQVANAAAAQNMGQYYARRALEGLVPQGTLLLGVSGRAVFPMGSEGSIGIAVNTDIDSESRVDVFVYAGGGVGLDVGYGVVAGWVPGEFSRVPGMATNITGSVLVGSTTVMYTDEGDRLGNLVSIGPSITPVSASGTRGKTWCFFGCR
jgi:hypothetical protein